MNKQIALHPDLDDDLLDVMEPDNGGSVSDELSRNLRALWSTFYRNRLLIAAIVGVFMLIGLGVTMLMTPKYRATTSIQIDQQSTNVLGNTDQNSVDPAAAWQDADRFLQTQVDVLQSRAMAITVMQDLNLNANDDFIHQMGGKPADRPAGPLSLADTKREQILNVLSDGLRVDLPRNSRVADISFTSPDPRLAARVANAFAADFMIFNMKRKFGSSTYARNFLESQLSDTRSKLEQSERALLDYARSAQLLDVSGGIASSTDGSTTGTPRSLTTSNLVQINDAYAQAQAARVQAQQHWEQAAATPPMQLQEVLTNPAVMQLAQLKAQAQAAYQQDLQRHKPDYPQMQQAAAHIAELDRQLNSLATSIRGSIKEQYATALKQEQALSGQVNGLKSSTQNEQSRSVEYNILKRAVDTNRTMYDSLLQRYAEVSAQAGVAANNISQVDVADTPDKPVSPKPLINLALAMILGMMAAAGFVLLRDKFDDSVRTPEDVNSKLGLTFLNSTPMLDQEMTPDEALSDPRSALSEAYSALRTSIELSHKGGAPRTLAVTSTRQSEGKSTSAFAIARNFAKIGRSVVLIDGDLRKPSLHRLANVPNGRGFSNLLARMGSIDEAIQPTETPNLSLISAGPLPPNPAELLSGARLPELINELAERFDVVVIDAPPVLGLADTVLIGSTTEATLFVVEANGSHHGHAKTAVRRLTGNGITIIGALLTKYDARKIGYGYGYGYNYTYSYSYGQPDAPSSSRKWPWSKK
ncbi:GumC family protein [Sphingomonas oryzagri]|uniref:Polysaccharide biosynthesis tyrosine autokinase n=1 Tax=Sphingomonas oryzagri TaxID=3042314 RepID=A0ABT6MWT7_9SPHN|nr:polysaccharide biosynthesis tyrosine autokinase [Sphingomonas oryzagri]MDH7637277.1 polysaccharide biosynthesis tyrosine autokinase [Sphingomonas oryzagri]